MNYTNIDWNQAVQNTLADYEKTKTEQTKTFEKKEFDLTKYFTLMLPKGVNTEEKVVRFLPLNAADPFKYFEIVKFHNLQVDGKFAKLYDPAQDGEESPLNDMNKILLKSGDTDEERKENKTLANNYKSREFYIVKLIERGKEHEGPKFWRFNKVNDGSGIMDKLIPLMKRLDDKKPGGGAIWRPDAEGRDIVVSTIRDTSKVKAGSKDKDGYTKVSQIMVDDPSPLSADEAQSNAWLNDPITWKDVYKKKPIDYLRIVAQGCTPVWDKEAKKFVAKSSETHTNTAVSEPKQNTYSKPPAAEISNDVDDEPTTIVVDDLPF